MLYKPLQMEDYFGFGCHSRKKTPKKSNIHLLTKTWHDRYRR